MITNDQGLHDLKHHILKEVCLMAWNDNITHEERERLVHSISPGPKPSYRCCIYKERAIVQERIHMAMGGDRDNPNPVQVMETVFGLLNLS